MDKKGSIKIQETIMVMFVFIVIFFLVLIIFYRFTVGSIQDEEREYEFNKFNLLIESIPNMPEFKCSELEKEKDCVDVLKLLSFNRVGLLNEDYYKSLFEGKSIYIEEVYPNPNSEICRNSYQACGRFVISSDFVGDGLRISGPVVLYYPNEDEYRIGKVVIEGEI